MASFFYYGRLSSAQLDHWQAPTQRPIIDQRPVEQTAYRREIKDNGYKSVYHKFLACTSKEQVLDEGIRQKSTKQWTRSLLAVPFVWGATEPRSRGLWEKIACIQVKRHDGTPCVACWQGSRQITQKSECMFRRSPVGRSQKNCVFIRPPMRTG